MNSLLNLIAGKKTYATSLLVIALLLGQWMHLWVLPTEIYGALGALGLAFLRAGVKREVGETENGERRAENGGTRPGTGLALGFAMVVGVMGVMGIMAGCASKLESGGAYAPVDPTTGQATVQPDKAFYVVDATFDLAYSTIDAAFKFERDNRLLLWKASPEIKHALDQIRPEAVKVRDEYSAVRTLYLANPVPANLSALQSALAKVQQLAVAASAALPAGGK